MTMTTNRTAARGRRRTAAGVAAATAVAAMAACGGGGGDAPASASGTLSVSLTDNPCDHRAVFVTIERLRVHRSADAPDGDAGWRDVPLDLTAAQRRVNLLELQNGALLKLGDTTLEPGAYTQLRLVLAENTGSTPAANQVVLADGSTVALETPSAQRSGLKLIHPFRVEPGQVVDLTLDFDACRSIVTAGRSGRHLLKPTIAVIPMTDVGRIAGHATPGALVSAQVATAAGAPTLVKATTADPVTGAFTLSPLPARPASDPYTVVVAGRDRASAVVAGVPVVAQQTTVLSTAGAPIPPGAPASASSRIAGTVSPAGLDDAVVRALQSVGGRRVEIAATRPDATLGSYALTVPRAGARWATWSAAVPGTPLSFQTQDAAAAGRYTVEAGAAGYARVEAPLPPAAPLDASAGDVAGPSFALTLAP